MAFQFLPVYLCPTPPTPRSLVGCLCEQSIPVRTSPRPYLSLGLRRQRPGSKVLKHACLPLVYKSALWNYATMCHQNSKPMSQVDLRRIRSRWQQQHSTPWINPRYFTPFLLPCIKTAPNALARGIVFCCCHFVTDTCITEAQTQSECHEPKRPQPPQPAPRSTQSRSSGHDKVCPAVFFIANRSHSCSKRSRHFLLRMQSMS